MRYRLNLLILAVALVAASSAVGQDIPSDLKDLVGARAAGGETQLKSRGYEFVNTTEGTDQKWSNWWNSRKKACVTVSTVEGRYDSIVSTLPADCKKGTDSSGDSSGSETPSDVSDLVGSKAAGGETQLKSRGYRFVKTEKGDDRSYSNWWHNSRKVCLNVVTMDGRYDTITKTLPADCNRGGNGGGGGGLVVGSNPVNTYDLIGSSAASGETAMTNRGFRNVQTYKVRMNSVSIWWRWESEQCLQIVTTDGKYKSIVPLQSHALCK